jgi:hypothetical protein
MIKQPNERTVQFDRATYIAGTLVAVGETRTFPTGFAAELVSARKAHFKDPDPQPEPVQKHAATDTKHEPAAAATKGK